MKISIQNTAIQLNFLMFFRLIPAKTEYDSAIIEGIQLILLQPIFGGFLLKVYF